MSTEQTVTDRLVETGAIPPGIRRVPGGRGSRMRRFGAAVIVVALLTSACTSGGRSNATTPTTATPATTATTSSVDAVAAAQARVDAAQSAVADAQGALSEAGKTFCGVATDYVEALDRYGKLFTDEAATVGDVKTAGADLVAPRENVSAAGGGVEAAKTALTQAEQELIDAQAALTAAIASASSKPAPTTTPATATPTTLVPRATMERVQQAEKDLADAEKGITDQTLLTDATAEYNSAAFALQIAWLQLLSEAGCLTDKEQANAVEQVTAYTTQLQTELKQVGYYTGPIDGIYGPQTVAGVKKLQADSGLPETGFVDAATSRALDEKLAALGQQTAAAAMTQTATRTDGAQADWILDRRHRRQVDRRTDRSAQGIPDRSSASSPLERSTPRRWGPSNRPSPSSRRAQPPRAPRQSPSPQRPPPPSPARLVDPRPSPPRQPRTPPSLSPRRRLPRQPRSRLELICPASGTGSTAAPTPALSFSTGSRQGPS